MTNLEKGNAMSEYDKLAEVMRGAWWGASASGGGSEAWQHGYWQAAAKAAREYIAAEADALDGWVEVQGVDEIRKGDEVRWTEVSGDIVEVRTGVAHYRRAHSWVSERGRVVAYGKSSDRHAFHVRRAKQEPPTAPLIIAYELDGEALGEAGRVMAELANGDYEFIYGGGAVRHERITRWSGAEVKPVES